MFMGCVCMGGLSGHTYLDWVPEVLGSRERAAGHSDPLKPRQDLFLKGPCFHGRGMEYGFEGKIEACACCLLPMHRTTTNTGAFIEKEKRGKRGDICDQFQGAERGQTRLVGYLCWDEEG